MAWSSADGDSAPAAEEYVPLENVLHLRSYNARRVSASNGELLARHIFQSGYSTIAAVFAVGYYSRQEYSSPLTEQQHICAGFKNICSSRCSSRHVLPKINVTSTFTKTHEPKKILMMP